MDGMTLLQEAQAAGLTVTTAGDKLVIRGSKKLAGMAKKLLANKSAVMQALGLSTLSAVNTTPKIPDEKIGFVGADNADKPEVLTPRPKSKSLPITTWAANRPDIPPSRPAAYPWPIDLAAFTMLLTADDLPKAPFDFRPGHQVTNAERFLRSIQQDVARGPHGLRARHGALQDDLQKLHALLLGKGEA